VFDFAPLSVSQQTLLVWRARFMVIVITLSTCYAAFEHPTSSAPLRPLASWRFVWLSRRLGCRLIKYQHIVAGQAFFY